MTEPPGKSGKDSPAKDREARLRTALRDNLRRRKDQVRRRGDQGPGDQGSVIRTTDKDGET